MPIVGNNQVGRALPNIGFFGSQSWTPAYDLQAYVYVIGAGGSGARTGSSATTRIQGGAAGGCAVSFLTLLSSVTYTITIGAGGAVTSGSGDGAGNAGGNSSLAGSNITTMTGNGGAAGGLGTGEVAANAGGSASGGNICNNTGGNGGTVTNTHNHGSGGGAVGLWTTGNSSISSANSGEAVGGATLNYDSDSLPADYQDYYSWIYSQASMNILSPFPALFASQHFSQADFNESQYQYDYAEQANFLSGQFATNWRVNQNGTKSIGAAGPFCGGWAMYSGSSSYAGGGGLGGGGGSARGSGNGYAGEGGSGGVLIFPVDMG